METQVEVEEHPLKTWMSTRDISIKLFAKMLVADGHDVKWMSLRNIIGSTRHPGLSLALAIEQLTGIHHLVMMTWKLRAGYEKKRQAA